jgi:hypothetical protein
MPAHNTKFGDDSRPDTRSIYAYVIRQLDIEDAPALFLTSYDGEFEIANMPDSFGADNPQVFSPANIGHGPISREGNFDKTTFTIHALTRDITGISRYALTGAVPRIQFDVIKVNPGPVESAVPALWSQDTLTVQTGLMNTFGFQGFNIQVECVPPPLFSNHEVPRWRFSRTCNRQLYGIGCGVNPTPFSLETNIIGINIAKRRVTIQGQHDDDDGDYFRAGVLVHQPTGMRLPIFKSELIAGNTRLTLHQWNPDFATTDVVVARAGCRHTFVECKTKFDNAVNFGGFSQVPNKNPSAHGV